MVGMSAVPPRLQPFLDPASPVRQLAQRLVDAGHECLLVGGSVRDALLDRPHTDVDLATDARPEAVEQLVRGWADHVWLQGARFGTVGCERDGVPMEITTFRADVYRPESRKPEVAYADDVETDLSRRDFTINAMALRLPDPALVDPYGGAVDLMAKRLRTPLSPEVSFLDDPLRMLRAARFIAAFELVPDEELVEAVRRHRTRLEIVSSSSSTTPARASGSLRRRASPTSSCPSSTACASSRTRCTITRMCSRTPSRWCATRAPSSWCVLLRCSTTWASPRRARSRAAA
jgi:poly(A) polymerase